MKTFDLTQLNQRDIVTFGGNNSLAVHRPTLWTCVDPPGRFHDVGGKDAGIIKLVLLYHRNRRLRVKVPDGRFRSSQFFVRDMLATFFYARATHFDPGTYFTEPGISWGYSNEQSDPLGIKGGPSSSRASTLRVIPGSYSRVLCKERMHAIIMRPSWRGAVIVRCDRLRRPGWGLAHQLRVRRTRGGTTNS